MNDDRCSGLGRYRAADFVRINVECLFLDINENRDRPNARNRRGRRDETVRGDDDFVARLDTRRSERQLDGKGSVGYGNGLC